LLDKTRKTLIGDGPDCIEAECAHLSGILQPNSAIAPNHAIQAFAAAGIATGLLSFETPIMSFPRGHKDVDAGVLQQLWRSVFPEADVARAVNTLMDRVPGPRAAEETFHRIHHER